jgi:hypothetical protein
MRISAREATTRERLMSTFLKTQHTVIDFCLLGKKVDLNTLSRVDFDLVGVVIGRPRSKGCFIERVTGLRLSSRLRTVGAMVTII